MKKITSLVVCLFTTYLMTSQIVINELDCDNPGIDDEEFIELLSETPNFPLDGYVVVLFNGSNSGGNSSYFTINLDGYITDDNGLLLIGSDTVTPFPQLLISANVIQNGADAVAIYQANSFDFPEGTVATIDNLVDVLMYDTSDSDDTDMIAIFNQHPDFTDLEQINEGSGNNTNSIQRNNDGSYTSTTPTPRALNDGSGIIPNGISTSITASEFTEGETIEITFTTQENVTSDYMFSFTLEEGTFDTADFTGSTTLTILAGTNTISTLITLVDDTLDEGDEESIIRYDNLPAPVIPYNNFVPFRIIDNDFTVANFGTPTNPTFGIVESTQPDGYYATLNNKSGTVLKQAMQDIIADPSIVRAQTYADIIDILKEADQNPANSNEVWLVYLEQGRAKLDFQTTSTNTGKWNREHTFPRSRAGYYSIEDDEIADGKDVFWDTEADSLRHGNSDAHALRAVDGPENSSRNNQFYGEYEGPTGTLGSFKGDVARGVFYLAVRYNGLSIVDGYPDGNVGELGDLQTLLEWHRNDPPDDFEMNRNNVVYEWQYNRNPFIDQPDLVEYIWGNMVDETWTLGVEDFNTTQLMVYPNPTSNSISIKGLTTTATVEVMTVEGRVVKTFEATSNSPVQLNLASGMYLLNISTTEGKTVKKLLIN
ncbi:endonuclease [Lacinutrix undariae]